MITGQIKDTYKKMPPTVKLFLKRALLLFVLWKLLYHLVLEPWGAPDLLLSRFTGRGTVQLMSLFYDSVWMTTVSKPVIYIDSVRIIGISDACNGLEMMVLYVGFLVCMPASYKRLALFSATGLVLIYLLNVLRCTALGYMTLEDIILYDFAHHYAFKLIIYGAIFYGWVLYSKKVFKEL